MANYNLELDEQESADVLVGHKESLHKIGSSMNRVIADSDRTIDSSGYLIKSLGYDMPEQIRRNKPAPLLPFKSQSWEKIVAKIRHELVRPASLEDLLTGDEIRAVEGRIAQLRDDFDQIHRLDDIDWTICGSAGVLAALVDIIMVGVPEHEAKGTGKFVEGGSLSNWIRDKVGNFYSDSEISKLERSNWVPYDAANSSRLGIKVDGLNPNTHRPMAPGHDPILGFIFGVRDILNGTMTVQGRDGQWFVQAVDIKDAAIPGMNLFAAIARVFGHLLSDVSTPAGLPAPLTVLFQGNQRGNIGEEGLPIGQVVRRMYYDGYDFSHFLSMSVPVLLIEVLVRTAYLVKRLREGYPLEDAIPFSLPFTANKPKLQTMLFTAHTIATAANAGKVYFTGDPLAVNYVQWFTFFRYAVPQIKWCLFEKENQRLAYTQARLDGSWQYFYDEMMSGFKTIDVQPLVL